MQDVFIILKIVMFMGTNGNWNAHSLGEPQDLLTRFGAALHQSGAPVLLRLIQFGLTVVYKHAGNCDVDISSFDMVLCFGQITLELIQSKFEANQSLGEKEVTTS